MVKSKDMQTLKMNRKKTKFVLTLLSGDSNPRFVAVQISTIFGFLGQYFTKIDQSERKAKC